LLVQESHLGLSCQLLARYLINYSKDAISSTARVESQQELYLN